MKKLKKYDSNRIFRDLAGHEREALEYWKVCKYAVEGKEVCKYDVEGKEIPKW